MEAIRCIKTRRSVRKFKNKKLDNELLFEVLDAGRHAPSSGNLQNWRFLVVEDQDKRNIVAKASIGQWWMAEASALILVCSSNDRISGEYGERGEKIYAIQNTAAAIQNMLLAAHDLGLVGTWVGAFREIPLRKEFLIPDDIQIHAIVALGYADEKPPAIRRLNLRDLLFFEEWGTEVKGPSLTSLKDFSKAASEAAKDTVSGIIHKHILKKKKS
jgi:nitroreductase